jgi:hypothetical protein
MRVQRLNVRTLYETHMYDSSMYVCILYICMYVYIYIYIYVMWTRVVCMPACMTVHDNNVGVCHDCL